MERRRDRAEHRLSRASPCQHGNHHLCPRRCDHPSGQPRQQGAHRSRRRAGAERRIRADARVLATTLKAGESAEYASGKTRNLYLVPAAGAVEVNGVRVNARDGVAIRDEARLKITALEDSELVLVDAA